MERKVPKSAKNGKESSCIPPPPQNDNRLSGSQGLQASHRDFVTGVL